MRQFRQIVDRAVLAAATAAPSDVNSINSAEFTVGSLCYAASSLDSITFVEGNKRLSLKEPIYASFLATLRTAPTVLASCLATDISACGRTYPDVTQIICSSLYGDGIVPENRALIVQLIKELCIQQVASNESPKRLLRLGKCAFSKMLKSFLETLPSARLFLYSALREAVIAVLVNDDMYLDIDAERAVIRFPPEGRMRQFGKEGSPEYQDKVDKYKAWATSKLRSLVETFVHGIQDSVFCFPDSLSSIIRYVYTSLSDAQQSKSESSNMSPEIAAICTDLIFSNFICHACINPEMYGIVDMHITPVARFNLMQVAQIIQVLAMSKFEDIDPRFREICSPFNDGASLTTVLDKVLNGGVNEPDGYHEQKKLEGIDRLVVLITESDLYQLTNFIDDVSQCTSNIALKVTLDDLMVGVPRDRSSNESTCINQRQSLHNNRGLSIADESNGKKQSILNKVRRAKSLADPGNVEQSAAAAAICSAPKEVLVIEIRPQTQMLGLLPEDQVLESEHGSSRQTKVRMNLNHTLNTAEGIESLPTDKRTKFSQDQESIATSDNLEAVSEGASTHSVESSLDETDTEGDDANDGINVDDDVEDNDNLSDMVSANVSSGRGTPNVSGRDTPSSNSDSDGETGNGTAVATSNVTTANQVGNTGNLGPSLSTQANIARPRPTLRSIPVETKRRTQNDIEEKFGKFDCNASSSSTGLAADETKSLLSDTWSTDVLASDSEAAQSETQHDHHPAAAVNFANIASAPRHASPSLSFMHNFDGPTIQVNSTDVHHQESTDDILEKYRKKETRVNDQTSRHNVDNNTSTGRTSGMSSATPSASHSAPSVARGSAGGPGNAGGGGTGGGGGGGGGGGDDGNRPTGSVDGRKNNGNNGPGRTDTNTPCRITSTKRILRRVLSNVNIHGMPQLVSHFEISHRHSARDDLLTFMRTLLSEAKHRGNSSQVVAVQEAFRSIDSLDDKSCHQVFKLLRDDHKKRACYIGYLINSRQQLLSLEAHFENVTEYLNKEKRVCLHNLIVVAVKLFLEGKDKALARFVKCFQKLVMSDEKVQLVDTFLSFLLDSMDKETIWKAASQEQLKHATAIIERSVMSQVYMYALYPNGDGDIHRDQILQTHIDKLSKIIHLNHEYLRIPSKYHSEAPWPSAIEEISTINAFKTPREKVTCIVNTCTIIMNLLSLASDRSVASADDLIPVMVYVLLQANPPSLLSTVQFINSFYENRFEGEEAYWWTQFAAAVEFTKTMDYEDTK